MNQTETIEDVHFPRAGVDVSDPFGRQPARPAGHGQYARTCAMGVNVRGFQPGTLRQRGGSRSGLSKFVSGALVAGWVVQHVATISTVGAKTVVQQSSFGRVVTLVAVSQGNVYTCNAGETAWTSPTNNTGDTPPLNYTGLMNSSSCNQLQFFADGVNWVYYKPSSNSVERWVPTAGDLPVDSQDNLPRLICTWRGRVVLAGLVKDPQNFFMSRASDPFDFDYFPKSPSDIDAVAGNLGKFGLIGDVVTALIPWTDDVLIFGCDSSIRSMRGDPLSGGKIDTIAEGIGIAWGNAWCMDPLGNVYFFSNRCSVYVMTPNTQPRKISVPIDALLERINTGLNDIRLVWNEAQNGLHVFVSSLVEPTAATHYFYEARAGAWWTDKFKEKTMNPLAACVFDGNEVGDRVNLIGSWDGYVRKLDRDAKTDDGKDIESSVVIGPIVTAVADDITLRDLQAELAEVAGEIQCDILVGRTAEEALSSEPAKTVLWKPGRNRTKMIERGGHAIYLRLSAEDPWAMEKIKCRFRGRGKVRRRGKF